MKSPVTWYVVMNGHEAKILNDLLDPTDPDHRETRIEAPERKLRDTLSDRPARSFASAGGGRRSAVVPGTDPLHEDKRRFLREVFDYLDQAHTDGAFDRLVLIGAPRIVGEWRDAIPDTLRPAIRREVVRNLVPLPADDLMRAVRALVVD